MDTFSAVRKGEGVRIKAVVHRPNKNAIPRIEPTSEIRPGWRSYILAWHNAIGGLPRSAPNPTEVDYLDPYVPDDVWTLRIYLPGGQEHIIHSQRLKMAPKNPIHRKG